LTGIDGAATRAFDIWSNDGIDVLMFVHEGRIAASEMEPGMRRIAQMMERAKASAGTTE
jgi:hypothetical protein